jgi:hypothetical protein
VRERVIDGREHGVAHVGLTVAVHVFINLPGNFVWPQYLQL